MIGRLRIGLALLMVAVATVALAPIQLIVLRTGLIDHTRVPMLWHRVVLKAIGLRLHVTGQMAAERPLLIAANHISWTDIMVLGAVANASFVAKSELAGWPIVGWLSRLQRTVYVERGRRRKSGEQASEIGRRLAEGHPMVLFAEGSTSDGNLMEPFKSTLFGAASVAIAEGGAERVFVQPLAVAYTRLHGLPMSRRHRFVASWIGDRELWPHIVQLLGEGAMDVELRFGEPVAFAAGDNRKRMAGKVEGDVRAMMTESLRDPRA